MGDPVGQLASAVPAVSSLAHPQPTSCGGQSGKEPQPRWVVSPVLVTGAEQICFWDCEGHPSQRQSSIARWLHRSSSCSLRGVTVSKKVGYWVSPL